MISVFYGGRYYLFRVIVVDVVAVVVDLAVGLAVALYVALAVALYVSLAVEIVCGDDDGGDGGGWVDDLFPLCLYASSMPMGYNGMNLIENCCSFMVYCHLSL